MSQQRSLTRPTSLRDIVVPLAVFAAALGAWEWIVVHESIPPYILPAPSAIFAKLIEDRELLFSSLWVTLGETLKALVIATVCGVALALLLAQSKWLERALLPFAIVLQVTPIIAIAPLLLVYLQPRTAVLVCAFLVAFFPILSNTSLGLASVDHGLRDLFDLYRASPWQKLVYLRLPAALPQFLTGLRIGGGLSLIGAIVAELAAGAAGQGTGLAFRIVEAGFRLDIPRMFAALALISVTGLAIYGALAALSYYLLRGWHESARERGD
ncbi:ABC transporter permease [Methylocystis sp. WRRC1]|uniref:ABC transporter permease n=1 Tax=unclassified Methylocystis TaxID=2625913 RepID=UPI0001F8760C|nr:MULTISPECIES: ABC transporter permease [unclassified Methylocystis]MCC3244781.1 ABC transporter permease [Methylocystis sp. WRRC1]